MCISLLAASAIAGGIGAAASAAGAMSSANAQAGQARKAGMIAQSEGAMDEQMRNLEARDITSSAAREADGIKRQAMLMRGQMAVAQSGSGTIIGEGSSQAALDQLDTLSSADALAALYSGVNKSVATRTQGQFALKAGAEKNKAMNEQANSIQTAGQFAFLSGLAKAGASAAQGYSQFSTPTVQGTWQSGTAPI